jgi:hypothetical protein
MSDLYVAVLMVVCLLAGGFIWDCVMGFFGWKK